MSILTMYLVETHLEGQLLSANSAKIGLTGLLNRATVTVNRRKAVKVSDQSYLRLSSQEFTSLCGFSHSLLSFYLFCPLSPVPFLSFCSSSTDQNSSIFLALDF